MAEALKTLRSAKGAIKKRFKKGRGITSGLGKTCGRGHRGQKCRSGYSRQARREGGQTPLYRRLPKRQVNERVNRKEFTVINLSDLQDLFDAGVKEINLETLLATGFFKSAEAWGLKILAKGELKSAVTVTANRASEAAEQAITKAGGKLNLV
jgi:large subunit ribosomal protein L15